MDSFGRNNRVWLEASSMGVCLNGRKLTLQVLTGTRSLWATWGIVCGVPVHGGVGSMIRCMVNIKYWWTGPERQNAWRFSGVQAGLHIRTWPVKFKNRENFERFFAGIYNLQATEVARTAWALKDENQSAAASAQATVRHTISSHAFANRHFYNVDDFLRGLDPNALRSVSLSFDVMTPEGQKGVYVRLTGSRGKQTKVRGGFPYAQVNRIGNHSDEEYDFPEFLPLVESLLEDLTVPMTFWDRITRKPVVSRFSTADLDEKRGQSITLRWSAVISFVTAAITAWLTALLT